MTATYLNRQVEGYIYYDLMFEENGETLLRLGGVSFRNEPTVEEMEDRVREIVGFNLSEYELTDIII